MLTPEALAPEANESIGGFNDIQGHLDSLMSGTMPPEPEATAPSTPNVGADQSTSIATSTAAGIVGTVATAAAATVAANVFTSTPEQPAEANQTTNLPPAPQVTEQVPPVAPTQLPAPVQPVEPVQQITAPIQAPATQPTAPQQVAPVQNPPPVPATPTEANAEASRDADALAELPDDLRNQLDDLMSSLENQTGQADDNAAETVGQEVAIIPSNEVEVEVEVEVEAQVEQPAQAPVQENRSVAEILGAMGMEVPGAEESGLANSIAQPPTPAPVEQHVAEAPPALQSAPPTPAFSNAQQTEATRDAGQPGEDSNEDIQAYMDRLLNRAPNGPKESPVLVTEPAKETPAELVKPEPVVPLSREEFVPNHKASRLANYDTLREIANNSSRAAIQQSTIKAKSGSIQFRLIAFVFSVIAAIVTFCLSLHYIGVMFVVVAAMSLALYLISNESQNSVVLEAMQKVSQKKPS